MATASKHIVASRSRIRDASIYSDDGVSELSSVSEANAVSIFRPRPPPSFDDDESVLLRNTVSRILDDALERHLGTFDAEIVSLDEPQIRQSSLLSSVESLDRTNFDETHSPSVGEGTQSLALPPLWRSFLPSDRSLIDIHGAHQKNENLPRKLKRYQKITIISFVLVGAAGGIAGLVVSLRKMAPDLRSATSAEQIRPSFSFPSHTPSITPSNDVVFKHPTLMPFLLLPSISPTYPPWTRSPSRFVASRVPTTVAPLRPSPPTTFATMAPALANPLHTLLPTPIAKPPESTIEPSHTRSFRDQILDLSPATAADWDRVASAQSLALSLLDPNRNEFDKFALLTLAFATNLTLWITSKAMHCDWLGVTCNDYGSVIKVELYHQNLEGTLPRELALATNLDVLAIAGSCGINVKSKISSSIPLLWGELMTGLRILELYDNNLSGQIPESLWMLSNLERLSLDGNRLSGMLPSSLRFMTQLELLDLSDNNLHGSIPEDLSHVPSLVRLALKNNAINSTLPKGIGSLVSLQEILLEGNRLGGPLPETIVSLTGLLWLSLYNNEFTGPIPSFRQMSNMEGLELRNNKLIGFNYEGLGTLSKLRIFD